MTILAEECGLRIAKERLLSQITVKINGGEILSVIGANGAGKTSLLRVMCADQSPSEGQVLFNDRPIHKVDLAHRAKHIAVLPQRSMLDFPFLVHEVIQMGRYPLMRGRQVDDSVVCAVETVLGLLDYRLRRYTTLSGGERQRVQIARVLAQLWDAPAEGHFFFDEPTAPLDLAHQLAFFVLMQRLAAKGAAIFLVSHDINLAARFSDRVVLMKEGVILAQGVPRQVVTSKNIKSAFSVDVEVLDAIKDQPVQIRY